MSLVKCSECGREISDKAAACPGCGAPVTPAIDYPAVPSSYPPPPPSASDDYFSDATTPSEPPPIPSPAGVPYGFPPPPPTQEAKPGVSPVGIAGVVLGIASMLMPYFASVFLVPAAFICGAITYKRGQKGLGATAMVLATIGLIGIFVLSNQLTSLLGGSSSGGIFGGGSEPVVTASEYAQITDGMTYEDVVGVIGDPGEELSRSEMSGYVTVMYSWTNAGGSNMNAMFQNNQLINKAQFGLE